MNIVVVGCGRVGSQLATMLSLEGHNVVVIDRDESAFRRLGGTFNGVTIVGLGFDEEVLEEAGIREADAFAATTDLDYVCGTTLVAESLMEKIKSGHGHHLNSIDDIEVIEFKAGFAVDGKRVDEVEIARRFLIFAVIRGRVSHIPEAEMVLRQGDIIFAAVKDEAFPKVERFMEE